MATHTIKLKAGREKMVRGGHPWIFSGAVAGARPDWPTGTVVEVLSHDGAWLGRGLWHADAALCARVYTQDESEPLDEALFVRRLDIALRLRDRLFGAGSPTSAQHNAYRLVFSEADGLSGLIIDRYADLAAVRVSAAVMIPYLPALLQHLQERSGLAYWQISVEAGEVEREGLDESKLRALSNDDRDGVPIMEHGLSFTVDLGTGQKTGFYLDQRDNRKAVAEWCRDKRVCSAYCYTGAFEAHAAAAGAASITGIDSSGPALTRARQHLAEHAPHVPADYVQGDVPSVLRSFRDARRVFDVIILDPPRLVAHEKGKPRGMRAYKDINRLAMLLLSPGGILATFSCSGLMTTPDFDTAILWAAQDSGRVVQQMARLHQPPDHPVRVGIPETEYLQGKCLRVI